jgi:hypothetical protein
MKKLILKLGILGIILLISSGITAQDDYVEYSYDANGNRYLREYFVVDLLTDSTEVTDTTDLKKLLTNQYNFKDGSTNSQTTIGSTQIKVYPNPVSAIINIEFSNYPSNIEPKIELYSQSGTVLLSKEKLKGSNQLDFSHLSPSTYLLLISIGDERAIWKIIKY